MTTIHPNPNGPTHAESPYDRKLKAVIQSVEMLLIVAPESDRSDLVLISGMLKDLSRS